MTDVKICGLTRPQDVELACLLGARFVGFNFAAASLRRISLERGRELASATRPGVARVGVFVDETPDEIRKAIEAASLDLVQIHRPLSEEDLSAARPVIAVARISRFGVDAPAEALLARCGAILLDTEAGGTSGGTGRAFDWSLLEGRGWPVPVLLAGGLSDENVGAAIERLRPDAVDVASGVESSPGVKDANRMRRFFAAVRDADERRGSGAGTLG